MKLCYKCNQIKKLNDFYIHTRMKDGHLNKCKECCKIDNSKNRKNKIDYYRSYDRERAHLPKRKQARIEYQKTESGRKALRKSNIKWRSHNPKKYKVHNMVNNYLRDRKIVKKPCEVCGKEKSQAHHDDYSKPLEVIWLCPACHAKRHKELRLKIS